MLLRQAMETSTFVIVSTGPTYFGTAREQCTRRVSGPFMTQNAYTDMVSGSHRSAYDSPGAMESHQTYDSNIFLIAVSTKPVVIFALPFQITCRNFTPVFHTTVAIRIKSLG
jgi:hypothetical protein